VLKLVEHQDFEQAVPTPDHFIPLVYIGALFAAADEVPRLLVDGYAYGSLSMASFAVDCPVEPTTDVPAATVPPARVIAPPDQSNI
jgi:4,5-DOPA dioxygenase extradiol